MENLNKDIFSPYLISGLNKSTVEEQICHVSTPETWATHVEVLATASVFEVPVVCKIHKRGTSGEWRNLLPDW